MTTKRQELIDETKAALEAVLQRFDTVSIQQVRDALLQAATLSGELEPVSMQLIARPIGEHTHPSKRLRVVRNGDE